MSGSAQRLALVVPSFPKLTETFIASKFLGLRERGWDVHVVCQRSDREEWRSVPDPRLLELRSRVHAGWPHQPRWLGACLMPLQLLRCLAWQPRGTVRFLRQGWPRWGWGVFRRLYLDAELLLLQPDVVHFEFGPLAVGRMHVGQLLGAKTTVSFRGYDLNYAGLDVSAYYDEVWNSADGIHLLGADLWRRAQRRGCSPDQAHWLIPPAIDVHVFDGQRPPHRSVVGTRERPLRVLSVGRLEWKKGYEYALQATRRLADQGLRVEYRIVGGGQFLEALAFARHEMGLDPWVDFVGPRGRPAILEQMRWADVLLHSAVSEGFCNAVLEAQAMRLPVVCSDADGLAENVVHGETGFVVPRRDPIALAQGMAQLAVEPGLRQALGDRGRARVVAAFQLAAQMDAFERMYRQVTVSANAR